jgi:hypothetical protein
MLGFEKIREQGWGSRRKGRPAGTGSIFDDATLTKLRFPLTELAAATPPKRRIQGEAQGEDASNSRSRSLDRRNRKLGIVFAGKQKIQ